MVTADPSWRRKEALFVIACAVFIYLHLFTIWPVDPIFYEEDHLYFMHDAWRMYLGEALYRDFFEFTFPGTQVVYLLLLSLFGTKFWLINAVILLQGLALTLICLAISKHLLGRRWQALLAPALFVFFGFRWFGLDGSHRMLSPIFFMLAILVLLKHRSLGRVATAGLCCALASYFTQQRGLLAVSAIAVFLLCEGYRNRTAWKRIALEQAALGAAFVATLLLLVLPFVSSAGAGTFLDYTVLYLRNYVQHPTTNYGYYLLSFNLVLGQGAVMSGVMVFYYLLIPLVYIAGFVYLWRTHYRSDVFLIALVGFFLAIGTFAPSPSRYFQVCMPGLILFAWLVCQSRWVSATVARGVVLSLCLLGAALTARLQMVWEQHHLETPTGRLVFLSTIPLERYTWLRDQVVEGEPVFEVYMPAVNFPLQLPNPTQLTFLLDYGYTPPWQVAQAIGNLDRNRPRFILWDGKWSKPEADRAPGDNLAPLYDYLRQHYEFRKAFTPYSDREMQAWQRKE
jgi:hypothetical protein